MKFFKALKDIFTKNAGKFISIVSSSAPKGFNLNPDLNKADMASSYKSAVYAAVERIADAVAMTPFRVFERSADGKLVQIKNPEHPALRLFNNPNPEMDKFELLKRLTVSYELMGNAYWYMYPMNKPTELWPLLSHLVTIVPETERSAKRLVRGYIYAPQETYLTNRSSGEAFLVDEILHFKTANPRSLFVGQSPLESMRHAVTLDEEMAVQRTKLLQNNAIPPAILSSNMPLSEKKAEKVRLDWDRLHKGRNKRGKIGVLDGGQWDLIKLGFDPSELQFAEGKTAVWKEIFSHFRVPYTIQGNDETTKAGVEGGERLFLNGAVKPRLARIEAAINKFLMPKLGNNLVFKFNDPQSTDSSFRLEEKKVNLTLGLSSINQELEEDGKDPVTWGDRPLVQGAMVQLLEDGTNPLNTPTENEATPTRTMSVGEMINEFDPGQINEFARVLVPTELKETLKLYKRRLLGNIKKAPDAFGSEVVPDFDWIQNNLPEKYNKTILNLNVDVTECILNNIAAGATKQSIRDTLVHRIDNIGIK